MDSIQNKQHFMTWSNKVVSFSTRDCNILDVRFEPRALPSAFAGQRHIHDMLSFVQRAVEVA